MEKSIYLSINLGENEQLVRVTVAYSDTFPVAGGCHCNRLGLYHSRTLDSYYSDSKLMVSL